MAGLSGGSGGLARFLGEALAPLLTRRLLGPVLLLALLLTLSNIVLMLNPPAEGEMPPAEFLVAAFVRLFGLFVIAVALLRLINHSPRPPWRPDGAFWLSALVFLLQLGLSVAVGVAARVVVGPDLATQLILDALVSVLTLPLAAWFTAIAVERPLAWRPGRWLRAWSAWLPHLVLWTVLLTVPLGTLHAVIDLRLVRNAGSWFWPLALIDGPLSLVILLSALALASEAYRRVARS